MTEPEAVQLSTTAMLAEFHEAFGQTFGGGGSDINALRIKLHNEENRELVDELELDNRVGIAQELADVVYVAYGTAHTLGIPLDAVIAEVHRANMSKRGSDGRFVLNEIGKVIKSPNFMPPDVASVLEAGGGQTEEPR